MATLLCTWELGGQLGHLGNLRLPIELALQAGHRVVLAARQLHRIHEVMHDLPITLLAAPFRQNSPLLPPDQVLGYGHLLKQQAIASAPELASNLRVWRDIYQLVQPDCVMFEHSPTALIAASECGFSKVVVGNGFTLPPAAIERDQPWAAFPNTSRDDTTRLQLLQSDAALLETIRTAQRSIHMPELSSLEAMYAQAHESWMLSWPELDHFGARGNTSYLGLTPATGQQSPVWPEAGGSRVFGYLQAFPAIERLLQALQMADVSALLFVRNLPDALRQHYAGPRLKFLTGPADLNQVAREANWVINHGNHGTVSHFALAGIPQLVIPLHQEQLFVALRMLEHGAAAMVYQDQQAYSNAVQVMQSHPDLSVNAKKLGHSMANSVGGDLRANLAARLAKLLP